MKSCANCRGSQTTCTGSIYWAGSKLLNGMKTLCYILAITIGAISIYVPAGCIDAAAQPPKFEPVTIQLRWSHQFQFAGYYAALEKGYYADEGLDVTLAEAAAGKDRIKPVLDGQAQYGIGDAGILKLRSDGLPLVVLAQIFQHSPNILITRRDSNIFGPYELAGKIVMLNKEPASSVAVRMPWPVIFPRSHSNTGRRGWLSTSSTRAATASTFTATTFLPPTMKSGTILTG